MGNRKTPGLQLRNGIWHIDKQVDGQRLCGSTGTGDRAEAEEILAKRIREIRQAKLFGVRPRKTWRDAAIRYLTEYANKASIKTEAFHLKDLDPYIGDMYLDMIHDGTLQAFKEGMRYVKTVRKVGREKIETSRLRKNKSINNALSVVRRILNLAARKWRDVLTGKTWLETAPLIEMLDEGDSRKPYPLSWDEQKFLIPELAELLARMSLFKVNTGAREQEVCKLRWDWEVNIPELHTSIFVVPAKFGGRDGGAGVKNREDRVIVLNRVARSVIEAQRGKHKEWVFALDDEPMHRMNTTGWDSATARAADKYEQETGKAAEWGYRNLRVHDLKHTFGRRLRAAGVKLETRKVLLGHKSDDITTHYSAAELGELIEAVERICDHGTSLPALTLIKAPESASHAKVTHKRKAG
jgi:integrase